jgi:reactive intermediate/imine deaminase
MQVIQTDRAPQAIGTYSQAVRAGEFVYCSGQIPLDPATMEVVGGDDMRAQVTQVFKNLSAVCEAAGGTLADAIKLSIFTTDLGEFPTINEVMATFIAEPYPARAVVGVASLPKGVAVEIEAILHLP